MTTKGLCNHDLDEREPRGLSTLEPKLWRPKGFSTLIWIVRMSIKGLFNFDLGCWNVDQKAFQLSFELPPTKSQNLGLDFKR